MNSLGSHVILILRLAMVAVSGLCILAPGEYTDTLKMLIVVLFLVEFSMSSWRDWKRGHLSLGFRDLLRNRPPVEPLQLVAQILAAIAVLGLLS